MGASIQVRPASSSPPVVLLKATTPVPPTEAHSEGLHQVDMFRDNALLGWERYEGNLLTAVYHVSGHHFDLFDLGDKVCLDLI